MGRENGGHMIPDLIPDWHQHAACHGLGDLFFPDTRGRPASREYERAKQICWIQCRVRELCLDQALAYSGYTDRHGVWGGHTPRERDRLRREQAA
jgi:hypothetical protein